MNHHAYQQQYQDQQIHHLQQQQLQHQAAQQAGVPPPQSFPQVSPRDEDVLCGRGGPVNMHPGNLIFRKVVNANKDLYKALEKFDKFRLAQSIVEALESNQSRFLTLQNDGFYGHQFWSVVSKSKAVRKTLQALREKPKISEKMRRKMQKKEKEEEQAELEKKGIMNDSDDASDKITNSNIKEQENDTTETGSVPSLTDTSSIPQKLSARLQEAADNSSSSTSGAVATSHSVKNKCTDEENNRSKTPHAMSAGIGIPVSPNHSTSTNHTAELDVHPTEDDDADKNDTCKFDDAPESVMTGISYFANNISAV